jgi:hypothetical protein
MRIIESILRRAAAASLCALACAGLPGLGGDAAFAATSNVQFNGSIAQTNICVILVNNDGRLGVNATQRQLSSKLTGGAAASADVVSTTNFFVSAIAAPTFTIAPAGGNTNTTLVSRYSGLNISRGRTFAERLGTSRVRLRTGPSRTRLTVHLIANRTGATSFPAGAYRGVVTLRCE